MESNGIRVAVPDVFYLFGRIAPDPHKRKKELCVSA